MKVLSVYCLTCWGHSYQIDLSSWKKIVDFWEEDGINQVQFWLSGLFRSKRYPNTFIYPGAGIDTSQIHELIRYAHNKGIEFFLLTGVFGWFGLDEMTKLYPEIEAKQKPGWTNPPPEWWSYGFCPSHPKSREITLNYCQELADEFSEADGLALEMRDEYGPCVCEECSRMVGEHGERGYGAAKASFLEELGTSIWQRHPSFKFCVLTGYVQQTGEQDIAYYDWIAQKKSDPRWIWFNARRAEEYPGTDGKAHAFTELSDHILFWTSLYASHSAIETLNDLRKWKNYANYGMITTFNGFRWGQIPAPAHPSTLESISTRLYRIAFREFWKNPDISNEEFKETLSEELFRPNNERQVLETLLSLHKLYLNLIPYANLREKVEQAGWAFHDLLLSPGLVGHRDAESAEKALRELRDLIEKNRPFLSKVHNYLEANKLAPCDGRSLLEEGSNFCNKFSSDEFLRRLDLILEYFERSNKRREVV